MTYKKFRMIKMLTAFFLAVIVGQAVIFNNFLLAIIGVITAIAVVFSFRKKVSEVMADERDYTIAGNAARTSLTLFSIIGASLAFSFMYLRNMNPNFVVIGSTLAYCVCALLIVYSAAVMIYGKQN